MSEEVFAFTGSLITKRLLTKTNGMPPLAERLVGKVANHVKIVEESIVDPVNKVRESISVSGVRHGMSKF